MKRKKETGVYPPIHENWVDSFSFDRLDMLWKRYPKYHDISTFATLEEFYSKRH